ncbi:MAG: hydroxymethylglutaryl-CoA reductase, degradative [Woeseiaceae bacterium]|nr:hydroxymethylglutaryl-CoA reductase, degradative [Woeseiaceae bacterium]
MSDSRIANFYRLSHDERIRALVDNGLLTAADEKLLLSEDCLLQVSAADKMIENVIGVFGLPLAVAPNFVVNQKDYVVPMVVEEPSIVAAVSSAAKLVREAGGFSVMATDPVSIGQIQVIDIDDADATIQKLYAAQDELLTIANKLQPNLKLRGGGAKGMEYFKLRLPDGRWTIVLHVLVDTRDAMGANAVNGICEGLAPHVERIGGGVVILKIISNLADRSIVSATASIPPGLIARDGFSGKQVRDAIVLANEFANADKYRATTHNKGIMNGIDAVALATGNDWRAIEAGAHAFAVRENAYRSLTEWQVGPAGELNGKLALPLKIGIVGGSQSANPCAAIGLRIAGAKTAPELAKLMAAVGLAQNFAALRALVTEGIQKGHMSLHARSVAASAGAPPEIFDQVVAGLIESGDVKPWKAEELIGRLKNRPGEVPTLSMSESVVLAKDARIGSGSSDVASNMSAGVAAGKVILLGEHAAVYDRHVLALPIQSAVTVRIGESTSGVRLAIPALDFEQQLDPQAPPGDGAAAVLALIMRHFGILDRGYDIQVQTRIPIAMGLGFSAAVAVAMIRAFDKLVGKGMSDVDVEKLSFECEKITHGTPSGIDNNIATYGEPVLYSKSSRTRTKPLQLDETPPLVIASSGQKGSTIEQVSGVRARYEKNRELYTTIFDEMDEIAMAGAIALKSRDYEQLGSMMNVCQGFLNAIEVSTPELEKMIFTARRNGAVGAKLTGSGGGGSIVALCPGCVTEVTRALEIAGYEIVGMQV